MSRAKKNVASGAATSVLGKKVMKTVINDETSMLINSMKRIVKKESGDAKKVCSEPYPSHSYAYGQGGRA